MKRAFQFRIYPTRNQEVILNRTLSTCRHLYNDALAQRKRQAGLNKLRKEFDVFPWGKPEWIDYYEWIEALRISSTDLDIRGSRVGIGIIVLHILRVVLNLKMEDLIYLR